VNGEAREVTEAMTLAGLLADLKMPAARVAVERNCEIVHREVYDSVRLEEGDVLEIVHLVGGG
jgi:thiamine biosynthesis protein ThiS